MRGSSPHVSQDSLQFQENHVHLNSNKQFPQRRKFVYSWDVKGGYVYYRFSPEISKCLSRNLFHSVSFSSAFFTGDQKTQSLLSFIYNTPLWYDFTSSGDTHNKNQTMSKRETETKLCWNLWDAVVIHSHMVYTRFRSWGEYHLNVAVGNLIGWF